jgi:hypothetical protein
MMAPGLGSKAGWEQVSAVGLTLGFDVGPCAAIAVGFVDGCGNATIAGGATQAAAGKGLIFHPEIPWFRIDLVTSVHPPPTAWNSIFKQPVMIGLPFVTQ